MQGQRINITAKYWSEPKQGVLHNQYNLVDGPVGIQTRDIPLCSLALLQSSTF